jgi:hypothetical protein
MTAPHTLPAPWQTMDTAPKERAPSSMPTTGFPEQRARGRKRPGAATEAERPARRLASFP